MLNGRGLLSSCIPTLIRTMNSGTSMSQRLQESTLGRWASPLSVTASQSVRPSPAFTEAPTWLKLLIESNSDSLSNPDKRWGSAEIIAERPPNEIVIGKFDILAT